MPPVEEFDEAIEQAWASADRNNPEPTVEAICRISELYPGNPRVLFEYACALGFAGHKAQAATVYEEAFAAGLGGDIGLRALLQYGSTLRNLGRFDESVAVLLEAAQRYPDDDAVTPFLALALVGAGRADIAVARLLTFVLDRVNSPTLQRYEGNLRYYADELQRNGSVPASHD